MASTTSVRSNHHSLGKIAKVSALVLAVLVALAAICYALAGLAGEKDTTYWAIGLTGSLIISIGALALDQIGTHFNRNSPNNDLDSAGTLLICWVACTICLAGAVLTYQMIDVFTVPPMAICVVSGIWLFRQLLGTDENNTRS
jgi:hypothetical protein